MDLAPLWFVAIFILLTIFVHGWEEWQRRKHKFCSVCGQPMGWLELVPRVNKYDAATGYLIEHRRRVWGCTEMNPKGLHHHDGHYGIAQSSWDLAAGHVPAVHGGYG